MSSSLDWMDAAACRDHPEPDIFFPSKTGKASRRQAAEAALVCRECPVVAQCREHKKWTGAESGVWGGHASPKGTGASSGGPHRKYVPHGTGAGAARHRRRGEKPCRPCLDGERAERKRRAAS